MMNFVKTLTSWLPSFYDSGGTTQLRVPVTQCNVSWLSDERYFITKYDKELDREIVVLKTVYCLDIKKVFYNVEPGTYKFIVRLNIEDGNWPSHGPNKTRLFAQWKVDSGLNEVFTDIDEAGFKKLRRDAKLAHGDGVTIEFGGCIMSDYSNGWFDLSLEDFELEQACDVTVGMVDNLGSWKTGMKWDYVELVRKDLTPTEPSETEEDDEGST